MSGTNGVAMQVPSPDVSGREAMHEGGEVVVLIRPQDEMPMIWHQAVGNNSHRDVCHRSHDDTLEGG
jgi:hypothetical protein